VNATILAMGILHVLAIILVMVKAADVMQLVMAIYHVLVIILVMVKDGLDHLANMSKYMTLFTKLYLSC